MDSVVISGVILGVVEFVVVSGVVDSVVVMNYVVV